VCSQELGVADDLPVIWMTDSTLLDIPAQVNKHSVYGKFIANKD